MTRDNLYAVAGTVWGLVGLFLMIRGGMMYQLAVDQQHASRQAVIISIVISLIIGGAKGKFVLSKTARRNKARIEGLSEPLKIQHVYAAPFYFLIAGMILLGILLRTFNEMLGGYVVVAAIYCGIGLALAVSSMSYWKSEKPQAADSES